MFTIAEINYNLKIEDIYEFIHSTNFSTQTKEAIKEIANQAILPKSNEDITLCFEDFQTVLQEKDFAYVLHGKSDGDNPAVEAVKSVIEDSLLNNISLKNIYGICLSFTVYSGFPILKLAEAMKIIYENINDDTDIIWGLSIDNSQDKGTVKVDALLAGFKGNRYRIVNNSYYKI